MSETEFVVVAFNDRRPYLSQACMLKFCLKMFIRGLVFICIGSGACLHPSLSLSLHLCSFFFSFFVLLSLFFFSFFLLPLF